MNLNIFNITDPSGRMSKESFLIKNYPEEYNYIIQFCLENNINHITFKEKVYLAINQIKELPICKNPDCLKVVSFKNSSLGYNKYCSLKCISSDPDVKKKKEEKSILKYGTKTPAESKVIKEKIIKTNNDKYGLNSPMCLSEI